MRLNLRSRPEVEEPTGDALEIAEVEQSGMGRTFRALQSYNYRLYWLGQMISVIGTWMQNTGLAWLVLQRTNSALALGTVSTVQFAPVLVFSLFGGVLADRFPKRQLLMVTQTVLLIQSFLLACLVAFTHIQIWQI